MSLTIYLIAGFISLGFGIYFRKRIADRRKTILLIAFPEFLFVFVLLWPIASSVMLYQTWRDNKAVLP
ncbi:MAG: hypothetical protein MKZ70_04820 [Opitutales bacterium]|nr:hypothetical protein [Opitutales bacterium]MCH2614001.1 hypothetical protein [Opitutales bacterium]